MTVYLDVVFLENILMNYLIMYTSLKIRKKRMNKMNMILAAIIGAAIYVMTYIYEINTYLYTLIKVVLVITMVKIINKHVDIFVYMEELMFFLLVSFTYGGIFYGIYYTFANIMEVDIYPYKLMVLSCICGFFVIFESFNKMRRIHAYNNFKYKVYLYEKNKVKVLDGLLDTGNSLKDPLTNEPILIVTYESVKDILPENILDVEKIKDVELIKKIKFVPYISIGNPNGLMIAYKIDKCEILESNNNRIYINNIYIGLNNTMLKNNMEIDSLLSIEFLEKYGGGEYGKITN